MRKPFISAYAWFTERGQSWNKTIGIVIAWTAENEWRAFIGLGRGITDKEFATGIVQHGAPFPLHEAKNIIKDFGVTLDEDKIIEL